MARRFDGALRVVMVGDVNVGRNQPSSAKLDAEADKTFGNALPILQGADVTLVNVEGAICDDSLPTLPGKTEAGSGGHLRMPSGPIERALKLAKVDAVSIATNHCMDYREEGMIQTIQALDKAGIPHAGGGRNFAEAHKPVFLDRKGRRIAFLAYASCYVPISFPAGENKPGCAVVNAQTAYEASYNAPYQPGSIPRILSWANPRDKATMIEDVLRAKEQADIVIVSWHWGQTARGNARSLKIPVELSTCFVVDYQEEMARAAIDAGADIIMGHHPHEPQGIEVYKQGVIFYSLGNFAFGGGAIRSVERDSCVAQVNFDSLGRKRFSFLPVRVGTDSVPKVLGLREGRYIVDYFGLLSRKYGTTFTPSKGGVAIRGPRE